MNQSYWSPWMERRRAHSHSSQPVPRAFSFFPVNKNIIYDYARPYTSKPNPLQENEMLCSALGFSQQSRVKCKVHSGSRSLSKSMLELDLLLWGIISLVEWCFKVQLKEGCLHLSRFMFWLVMMWCNTRTEHRTECIKVQHYSFILSHHLY